MNPAIPTAHRRWLLVPSFLTGPETFRGVASVLGVLDEQATISPNVRTEPDETDHLGPWLRAVIGALGPPTSEAVMVVGHSATCPRLPMVADALLRCGHDVQALILLNGRFPAADGLSPVEADQTLAEMLDGMVRPDDYLPPWFKWWGGMIVDMVPEHERERVFRESKPVPRSMFDQPIPVPELPSNVMRAFLATGDMYSMAYDRAAAEGWQVTRLDGEHLHLVVDPVTVACSLISLVGRPWPESPDNRDG